ncbi:dihydropteroate synthase [bacterium]|nr:dihydropteroate synthase [bacterium]
MEPRQQYFTQALTLLEKHSLGPIEVAPIYQTPAMLPLDAPDHWNKPYLNTVLRLSTELSAQSLLNKIKSIELKLGRDLNLKWGPRPIDLDILFYGQTLVDTESLSIPHPRLLERDFVLKPLLDIVNPSDIPKNDALKILKKSKSIHMPAWMHILNLSPDSFSDGKAFNDETCLKQLDTIQKHTIQYLDIGAASTRPNADIVSPKEEIKRIKPFLQLWNTYFNQQTLLKPRLSLDTMHASVAQFVHEQTELHTINDVSGLKDPEMFSTLQQTNCDYVLMHSLNAPVDPRNVMAHDTDPIVFLKQWLDQKLTLLDKNNIDVSRVIFDPGIGFGKTASQSLKILQNLDQFNDIPCRLLIGHSRKSFMKLFCNLDAHARDYESIGISMALSQHAVDIFRVHQAPLHQRAWLAYQHTKVQYRGG